MAKDKSRFFLGSDALRRRESLPLCYQVPTITIRLEWPHFEDSYIANPHTQEHILRDIESVWHRLSQSNEPIDSTDFWGPTAEFWHEGWDEPRDMYRGETGHPMIAIANYRFFEKTLSDLLPRLKATTNPRTDVLLTMFCESLCSYGSDAWSIAYHQKDDAGAIQFLETKRQEVANLLKPTMLMFFASIWTAESTAMKPTPPVVNLNPPQITIGGTPYALSNEQALYLQELLIVGDWMSDPEFKRRRPEVGGSAKPHRWRRNLPQQVAERLETHQSKGTRWMA